MSGKILIVDEVATNRIILKVMLSAAHFSVSQADSGAAALAQAAALRPDMIVAKAELADMDGAAFVAALRALPGLAATPVVLILPGNSQAMRIAALSAGADDVIPQPFDERAMMARLRSLLHQHHMLQDLQTHAGSDGAIGFGEVEQRFQHIGRVALLSGTRAAAMQLASRLTQCCRHQISAMTAQDIMGDPTRTQPPDVFVIDIPDGNADQSLQMVAELRTAPQARHSRVIALLQGASAPLAPHLLDMGINDVLTGPVDLDELSLRLGIQLRRKATLDRLHRQMQDGLKAAMTDPLTGLYNRRFALPFVQRLMAGSGDGDARPFAVMVADLDHFKAVNDTFGHAAGDRVLTQIAALLRSHVREGDMIARIGGEEFLIVMPDTSRADARKVADALCRIVRSTPITLRHRAEPLHVTVSIGVALGNGDGATMSDGTGIGRVEALLDQADRALYAAKAQGRNTVTVSARTAA